MFVRSNLYSINQSRGIFMIFTTKQNAIFKRTLTILAVFAIGLTIFNVTSAVAINQTSSGTVVTDQVQSNNKNKSKAMLLAQLNTNESSNAVVYKEAECLEAKVFATYSKEAFDSNVKLHISTVKSDANKDSITFDIGFTDSETNKEVEPSGPVAVKLDVNKSVLPEAIDPSSLKVKHLKEDSQGDVVETETVADASKRLLKSSDSAINVDDSGVSAEFVTDSFSQFTLSWDRYHGLTRDSLHIVYIDTEGHEFNELSDQYKEAIEVANGAPSKVDAYIGLADGKKDNIAVTIDGYQYEGAYLFENPVEGLPKNSDELLRGTKIDELVWKKKAPILNRGNWQGWYQGKLKAEILNNEDKELYGKPPQTNYLYLVYKPEDQTVRKEDPTMEKSKVVSDQKADGSYDITLGFSSDAGKEETKQTLDVMFLLDRSGSMNDLLTGNSRKASSRMAFAKESISKMVDNLDKKSQQGEIDVRYSMATFSDKAHWTGDWTSKADDFKARLNGIVNPEDGTNYDAALREVIEHTKLGNSKKYVRPNARKVVIFISDGAPTFYLDESGNLRGSGYEEQENIKYSQDAAIVRAKEILGKHLIDDFYTVGIGASGEMYKNLTELNKVFVDSSNVHTTDVYHGENPGELEDAFQDIAGKVTDIRANKVVVKDTLSKYVTITSDNGVENAKVIIKNGKGEIVAQGNIGETITLDNKGNSVHISYDKSTRQVVMQFTDGYELKEGYDYYLKINVVPNEEELASVNDFNDVELNNDQKPVSPQSVGIYTNGQATITYNRDPKGEDIANEPFGKPVIKFKKVDLVKKFEGLDHDQIDSLKNKLKFKVTVDSKSFESFEIKFNDENFEAIDGVTYRYKGSLLSGLPSSAKVSIEEVDKTQNIEFYKCETTFEPAAGKVEFKDSDKRLKTFKVVNRYSPNTVDISIMKKVEGNIADKDRDYDFTLSLRNGNDVFNDEELLKKINNSFDIDKWDGHKGIYTFKLKNGEEASFKIPRGIKYVVDEQIDASEGYTTQITVNGEEVVANPEHLTTDVRNADVDQKVVFINTRDMHPPTAFTDKTGAFLAFVSAGISLVVTTVYLSYKKYSDSNKF